MFVSLMSNKAGNFFHKLMTFGYNPTWNCYSSPMPIFLCSFVGLLLFVGVRQLHVLQIYFSYVCISNRILVFISSNIKHNYFKIHAWKLHYLNPSSLLLLLNEVHLGESEKRVNSYTNSGCQVTKKKKKKGIKRQNSGTTLIV